MFLKRAIFVGKSSILVRGLTILRNNPPSIRVLQDRVIGVALRPSEKVGVWMFDYS